MDGLNAVASGTDDEDDSWCDMEWSSERDVKSLSDDVVAEVTKYRDAVRITRYLVSNKRSGRGHIRCHDE